MRFAKKRYPQKRAFSILSNHESDRSVANCPIELIKYIITVSVQGCIHHFLNVGKKAIQSRIKVRITVLREFLETHQYPMSNIHNPRHIQSNQFTKIF